MLPSVRMLREVRTRAKRVALKLTDPSALRGMFIATRRCKLVITISILDVTGYLASHTMRTELSKTKRRRDFPGKEKDGTLNVLTLPT